MSPSRTHRVVAALAFAGSTAACAGRPAAAPVPAPGRAPVPVVPPPTAASTPAADTLRAAVVPGLGRAPAEPRTFSHTPGVTWDLDVLPYEGHERVQRYIALFTGTARTRFTDWLTRGTRYESMVRAKLRAGGLPEDLYYLALVESGYQPHAVSHAGAVGMWQFMAPTARDMGMRIDWWVDERRDPVRATDGAVRMLRWLRGEYGGSLFVAAAAYNGGPGRVSRGIAQLASADAASAALAAADSALDAVADAAIGDTLDQADDAAAPAVTPAANVPAPAPAPPATGDARFFALAENGLLRTETVNYVPQLVAAALVAKEAPRHGLAVRRLAPYAYDEVRVPALTPLAAVARASGASRAELLDLNPHLLRGLTPPGAGWAVRVPAGRAASTAAALGELDAGARRAFRRAVTRKRETYAALAARVDAPAWLLRAYNPRLTVVARGRQRGRLVSGQAVRVPTAAVLAYSRSAGGAGPTSLPPMPAAATKAVRTAKTSRGAKAAKRPATKQRGR